MIIILHGKGKGEDTVFITVNGLPEPVSKLIVYGSA